MGGVAGQHGRRLLPGIRVDKVVVHIDPHYAPGIPDGPKLIVRQVPADAAQSPAVGMGGDDRPLRQLHDVPEGAVAGVGHVRDDMQPLHPPDRFPSQSRQPLVRVRPGTGRQQVFLVPGQHPDPDSPAGVLLQPLQAVPHRLHALNHQKGKGFSRRLSGPGLRRRLHRHQPGTLRQFRPGAGHHLLRPPPAVPVRMGRPEAVRLRRHPDGQPQAADVPGPQLFQVAALQNVVLPRQTAAGHVKQQVGMSVENHHLVSPLSSLPSISAHAHRRNREFL